MGDGKTMGERVRGVLITPAGRLLMIRRVRAGTPPYWAFPGGGVEADDENRESALLREVREETGGTASIRKLLLILERDGQPAGTRDFFYLADVDSWDERARSGPEFLNSGSGEYFLDELTLSEDEIESRGITPDAMKRWLLDHHAGLDALPDLRDRAGFGG